MRSRFISFGLGIIIGGIVTFLVVRSNISKASHETAESDGKAPTNEVSDLKAQLANASAQLKESETRNGLLASKMQKLMQPTNQPPPVTKKPSAATGDSGLPAVIQESQDIMRTASKELRRGSRLLRMKERLHLTPEQENAMQEIMIREDDKATRASAEADLEKLLTPEQFAEMKRMQTEKDERKSNTKAWTQAAMQFSSLEDTFSFSTDQQEKVFAAVLAHEQQQRAADARAEANGKNKDPQLAASYLVERSNNELEALRPVLTPEQFALYQRYQEKMLQAQQKLATFKDE